MKRYVKSLEVPCFSGRLGGFFVLGYVGTSLLLQLVGTDSKTAGISKGWQVPWIWGFQEGRKRPVGTRFCCVKSSVLYLLRPLVPERECCLTEHTISGDSRTGGFCVPPGWEMCGFAYMESDCSCVGGVAE